MKQVFTSLLIYDSILWHMISTDILEIPCRFTMFTRLSLDLKGGLGKIAGWKPFLVPLVDLWTS